MSNSIKVVKNGDIAVVTGPGFSYKRVGGLSRFEQTGKIPSIRAAKVVCKLLAGKES